MKIIQQGQPGKYDNIARLAAEETNGEIVLVGVLNGNRGSGCSVAHLDGTDVKANKGRMATLLRMTADVFDHEVNGGAPVEQVSLVQDALRWRFSMAALNNPGGPEDSMGDQVGEEFRARHDAEQGRHFSDQAEEIIDEAIRRLKANG